MGRTVLGNFRLHIHTLHLDFVYFQYVRITGGQALFIKRLQFIGILHADIHQCLFLIQQNKVQTEVFRIQQDIPADSLLLLVHRFVLQSSLTVAGDVLGRKIKALRSDKFRSMTTFGGIAVKRAVAHRRIRQIIVCTVFHLGRIGGVLLCLEFFIVLLNAFQDMVDALSLHQQGGAEGYYK